MTGLAPQPGWRDARYAHIGPPDIPCSRVSQVATNSTAWAAARTRRRVGIRPPFVRTERSGGWRPPFDECRDGCPRAAECSMGRVGVRRGLRPTERKAAAHDVEFVATFDTRLLGTPGGPMRAYRPGQPR